jgi:CoA:oxalate CoA-transferase
VESILTGIVVLDISEYIAGPYCGSLLADMGARVIKVEPPDGAEERRLGARERYRGNTRPALAYNRGKESLAVDLRHREGREILHKLAAIADVVIENFPPAVARKRATGSGTSLADGPTPWSRIRRRAPGSWPSRR